MENGNYNTKIILPPYPFNSSPKASKSIRKRKKNQNNPSNIKLLNSSRIDELPYELTLEKTELLSSKQPRKDFLKESFIFETLPSSIQPKKNKPKLNTILKKFIKILMKMILSEKNFDLKMVSQLFSEKKLKRKREKN